MTPTVIAFPLRTVVIRPEADPVLNEQRQIGICGRYLRSLESGDVRQARDDEVVAMYTAGVWVKDIASRFEMSIPNVYSILKARAITVNRKRPLPSDLGVRTDYGRPKKWPMPKFPT